MVGYPGEVRDRSLLFTRFAKRGNVMSSLAGDGGKPAQLECDSVCSAGRVQGEEVFKVVLRDSGLQTKSLLVRN